MTFKAEVKRGPESWNYIYIVLGFALAIEADLIQIMKIEGGRGLMLYSIVAAITVHLFLFNGPFQNKLTGIKSWYEEKWR